MSTQAAATFFQRLGKRNAPQHSAPSGGLTLNHGIAPERKRKGHKRGGNQRALQRCATQRSACETFIKSTCGANTTCTAAGLACCPHLEICAFTAFFDCFSKNVV